MITKSLLDVAEIIPTITSTAPSLRFAVLRTAQPRVCDLSFYGPIKRVESFSVAVDQLHFDVLLKGKYNRTGPER